MARLPRTLLVAAGILAVAAVAAPQAREVIRVLGVGAVVDRFGGDINRAINRIANHRDSGQVKTKVVPILTINIGNRGGNAIGAAQVSGAPALVDKVKAVAAPETKVLDIRARALIPVSDRNVLKGIKKVDGVGVSGIVDIRL